MKEKKTIKVLYLAATFLAFLIALTFFYGQSFEESIYTDGFPVPYKAEIVKISSGKSLESYRWTPASEENGLPLRYKLIIRLSGWKEIDRMGSMTTYQKDDIIVDVISQNRRLELYGRD